MPDPTPLAPRDLLILVTLAEGPSHGYGLISKVKARSNAGIALDPANLYRVLRRMRRLDWIEEQSPRSTPESSSSPEAKRRRTYTITDEGNQVLEAEVERLELLLQQTKPALANSGSN